MPRVGGRGEEGGRLAQQALPLESLQDGLLEVLAHLGTCVRSGALSTGTGAGAGADPDTDTGTRMGVGTGDLRTDSYCVQML